MLRIVPKFNIILTIVAQFLLFNLGEKLNVLYGCNIKKIKCLYDA